MSEQPSPWKLTEQLAGPETRLEREQLGAEVLNALADEVRNLGDRLQHQFDVIEAMYSATCQRYDEISVQLVALAGAMSFNQEQLLELGKTHRNGLEGVALGLANLGKPATRKMKGKKR